MKKIKCFPASGDAFWNRGLKLNMWPCFVKKMKHHKILPEIGPGWRGGWVEKIMITTFCRGVLLARNRVTPRNSTRPPHIYIYIYCNVLLKTIAMHIIAKIWIRGTDFLRNCIADILAASHICIRLNCKKGGGSIQSLVRSLIFNLKF